MTDDFNADDCALNFIWMVSGCNFFVHKNYRPNSVKAVAALQAAGAFFSRLLLKMTSNVIKFAF